MSTSDFIVIGAGVVGCSVAFHLARLGAGRITVVEQRQIAAGTTAQSSGILRTHYSVAQNVELARRSWSAFEDFAGYVGDEEASSGLVRCGYMIAAPEGERLQALEHSLAQQRCMGIPVLQLTPGEAAERLPIARFDDAALIGFEPEAGFADAYLVATGFARAARRRGVRFLEGVAVQSLRRGEGDRINAVVTADGVLHAGVVISTQNIWAAQIERWTGIATPVVAERHRLLALQVDTAAYTPDMPVFKDLASPAMLYLRSYGGAQMLVGEGLPGEALAVADDAPGEVDLDFVAEMGAQVARRFPAYAQAGLASSWTGVYDVTPDWNPVLGMLPQLPGLVVAYGFSGHGFKLSPAVGQVIAQCALGMPTDVSLQPYALERFRSGQLLRGRYGLGAVS